MYLLRVLMFPIVSFWSLANVCSMTSSITEPTEHRTVAYAFKSQQSSCAVQPCAVATIRGAMATNKSSCKNPRRAHALQSAAKSAADQSSVRATGGRTDGRMDARTDGWTGGRKKRQTKNVQLEHWDKMLKLNSWLQPQSLKPRLKVKLVLQVQATPKVKPSVLKLKWNGKDNVLAKVKVIVTVEAVQVKVKVTLQISKDNVNVTVKVI